MAHWHRPCDKLAVGTSRVMALRIRSIGAGGRALAFYVLGVKGTSLWLYAALAASAEPALACRIFQPPEQRIRDAYARNAELQVALVHVTEARHLSFPMRPELRIPDDEMPWRVTASVNRLIVGNQSPELLVFDRGWGEAACDDGTMMPRTNDAWVVYYLRSPTGQADVLLSYPLQVALGVDPRLPRTLR